MNPQRSNYLVSMSRSLRHTNIVYKLFFVIVVGGLLLILGSSYNKNNHNEDDIFL
jgi:hypothetical protein